MPYLDLREYLSALESNGLLHRISKEVDKDWEIAAVCRRAFQAIAPERRPALMFERVLGFDIPVVAGVLGASPEVYALALETTLDGILDKWKSAELNPMQPRLVDAGPCKDNVIAGSEVDLTKLPIPTWTVGHDPAPYITSAYVVTKDPQTHGRNVGTYRVQLKGPARAGLMISPSQDGNRHIRANEAENRPTPVAIVLGTDPAVGLASVSDLPYGVDELAVAGGLRGAPIDVVRCETIDLEVPATAEIVLEGELLPGEREAEGPFGEYTGFMGSPGDNYVFHVRCITHRNQPIFQAFVSQMPPSESSGIRRIGREQPLLRHLRDIMRLPVTDVHYKESGGSQAFVVVSINRQFLWDAQQVAMAVWSYSPNHAKVLVIVDDDIDVRDGFAVEWAISFRFRPEHDTHIYRDLQAIGHDPSSAPYSFPKNSPERLKGGKMLIDATMKHEYPPLALPPREHIERVAAIWDQYGFMPTKA